MGVIYHDETETPDDTINFYQQQSDATERTHRLRQWIAVTADRGDR